MSIIAKNLVKTFGKNKALDDFSLEVKEGSFFALLGPNGAGKTTFINILGGLVKKTSGSVSVCGFDLDSACDDVKRSIGICIQEFTLDPFLSVEDYIKYTAGYYGISNSSEVNARTDDLLCHLGLDEHRRKSTRMLSGGMKRRLILAKALIHAPKVVILDEPTAGVDIELRQIIWNYIKDINKKGTTILLTTHYLEEAQILSSDIAFIDKGKVLLCDSKQNVLNLMSKKKIQIVCDNETFDVEYSSGTAMDVINSVLASGKKVLDFKIKEPNLEDVFVHILGGGL